MGNSDDDEEPSDKEGEKEQYIALPLYVKYTSNEERLNIFQSEDPLEGKGLNIIGSDTENTSTKSSFMCHHCPFLCDDDCELEEHINIMHKSEESPLHSCPHCPFESRKLMELINHKIVCPKEKADKDKISKFNGKESAPNTQIRELKTETNHSEDEAQIKSINPEKSNEENTEVRKPLIKVRPEFSIKTFEKNLEECKKRAEQSKVTCEPVSILLSSQNNKKEFKRKKCDVTVVKCSQKNIRRPDFVIGKEIGTSKTHRNDGEEFKDEFLGKIKALMIQHSLSDHNYNKIDFLEKLGVTSNKSKDDQIIEMITRLQSFVKPIVPQNKVPHEHIIAFHLLRELQCTLHLRARRRIELSSIKAKAGMVGGATKRSKPKSLTEIEKLKSECPDDILETPLQERVAESTSNLKRPLPDEENDNKLIKKLKLFEPNLYLPDEKLEQLVHTCKKRKPRKGKHKFVGKIGKWSRIKRGAKKKICAACQMLANAKSDAGGTENDK